MFLAFLFVGYGAVNDEAWPLSKTNRLHTSSVIRGGGSLLYKRQKTKDGEGGMWAVGRASKDEILAEHPYESVGRYVLQSLGRKTHVRR